MPPHVHDVNSYLSHKGENIGEEEGEPADKEDDEDDDQGLGRVDVVSKRLIPGTINIYWSVLSYEDPQSSVMMILSPQ